jgi:hypothetical protein
MNHKVVKMRLGTWRKLRGLVPAVRNETVDDYIKRVCEMLKGGIEAKC